MSCHYRSKCVAGSIEYTIRRGDTLDSIAREYGTSVMRILEINNGLNPFSLAVGRTICVPLAYEEYPNCRTTNYYVVRKDDTLDKIADYFNVSVEQILYANMGISPEDIYEDMVLCIPVGPSPVCLQIPNDASSITVSNFEGEVVTFSSRLLNSNRVLVNGEYKVINKRLDVSEVNGPRGIGLSIPNLIIRGEKPFEKADAGDGGNIIVLSDEDINILFNLVPVGTAVSVG